MILYLWTHWFWITSIALITVNCLLITANDPLTNFNIKNNNNNSNNNNNNNNNNKLLNSRDKYFDKREPLRFPIPVQVYYNNQEQIQHTQNEQKEKIKQIWLNNLSNEQIIPTTTTETILNINKTKTSVNTQLSLDKQTIFADKENGFPLLPAKKSPSSVISINQETITAATEIITTEKFINQNLLTRLINLSSNQNTDNTTAATTIPFNLIDNKNNNSIMSKMKTEYENKNKSDVIEIATNRKNKSLNDYQRQYLTRQKESMSINDIIDGDNGILSSEALSIEHSNNFMDPGLISAICLGVFGIFSFISITIIIFYRRKYINKPQVLEEPDSSIYIDDSTIRDNSDEMYSLDNDSFLNSLEAMTIQNYWTDSVKHTKL